VTRTAAEIGAGLEPPRPGRAIPAGERIHVLGASGAAGAAALLLAARSGAVGSGCDPGGPGQYSAPLVADGIPLAWQHDPVHVSDGDRVLVDRLAVTKALTSVRPDHPELTAARRAGIPATSVQQLIADVAATRRARLLGVAGTHGKSTTTGWLVHLLAAAGRDPSAFVGALMTAGLAGGGLPSTVRDGSGPDFVVEADEYAGNFDPYRPAIGLLTTADWDHPDVFATLDDVLTAFEAWIRAFDGAGEAPVLIANAGDAGVARLLPRLGDWPGRLVVLCVTGGHGQRIEQTFASGMGPADVVVARARVQRSGGTVLSVAGWGSGTVEAVVGLPGRHNAENGLAAASGALAAGAGLDAVVAGLASFTGVGRRLERKGDVGGVVVLDDYGHHPTAIAATLEAVRQAYPGRRTWAVYEPLTYHRTASLLEPFATVLAGADRVAVADIWAGRDPDMTITSAEALARAVRAAGGDPSATAPGSVEATADYLAGAVTPGDVVVVMGGGRSYVIAERLVSLLRERSGG
jgi:UDP-N-acetylmuramate--alanine ligase